MPVLCSCSVILPCGYFICSTAYFACVSVWVLAFSVSTEPCLFMAMSVVCHQWSFLSSFFEGCLCPKGHACMLLFLSVYFFSGIVFCWLSRCILVFLYVHCCSVISISGWLSIHTCTVPVVLPLNHQVKQYIGCAYIPCICYVAILVLFIYFLSCVPSSGPLACIWIISSPVW